MASKAELKALITLAGRIDPSLQSALLKASGESSKLASGYKKAGVEINNALGRVKSGLISLQGIAAATIAVIGIKKLTQESVGAAMTFEQQQISMEHWLKGNKQLAQEAIGWLEKFAAATPFEMADLFPALTRGIGLTGGDVKTAERLVTLSADMAALTPGKTVQDAIEALADAQMGEFERLKEFNMKFTQEEYKKVGGFAGLIAKAEKAFSGGADDLSKSGIGLISTITDNLHTYLRSAGTGILEAMKPRLMKITAWFGENEATVARWKSELVKYGQEAAEAILSRMEKVFLHIKVNYLENPNFKQLTFAGKINFILDDISVGFNNWLNAGGSEKITAFGSRVGLFIGQGVISIMPELGKIAAEALINSFAAGLKNSFWGSVIMGAFGGAVVAAPTGVGVLPMALMGGFAGGGAYLTTKGISALQNNPQLQALGRGVNSGPAGYRGYGSTKGYANGGIATRPSIFGEGRSAEIAIPIERTPRSLSLLNQANRMIGEGQNGGINITYSPAIYASGNSSEVKNALDTSFEQFTQWVEEYFDGKARVSYGY